MSKASLHILITDPHSRGGGQVTYVTSLARELVRAGHRVTIACRQGSVLVQAAADTGSECLAGLLYRGGARPLCWYQDIRTMQDAIVRLKPDVLHVNGSQDHWTCALANRRLGFPAAVVRTRHNTYPVKRSYPNRLLNRAWTDYQIVVCDMVRQDLARHPAFDARHMCTIHNGVDADAFAPNPDTRERARSEFGYQPGHLVIGMAARLVPAKGHALLFKAVKQVVKGYPDLRVLLLGQGALERELRELAAQLELGGIVQFAGFREDMSVCVQAFDIGVQPSIDCDTSSFSLKEQMAAEIPVIASDYGGLREIVTDGMEGYVAPTGTVAPLASALRRLLDAPELRRKMGAAGRKRVLREFSVGVFAERSVKAYEKAIQIHRERTSS